MRPLLLLFLLSTLHLSAGYSTFKLRMKQASPGDYIVTEQAGIYSLILIRSIDSSHLVLEEITVQPAQIDDKKIGWKQWVENGAPDAISWSSMTFDLKLSRLTQCYSYLQKQWFFFENANDFVHQLFEMPLYPTQDKERKRIGPQPPPGEIDRRRLWKPRLIRDGKKVLPAEFEVLRTKWPADKSKLSGCILELYFDATNRAFPFPYWMEVQHPHYTFKVRVLDSGTGIRSPTPQFQVMNKTSTPIQPPSLP